MASKQHESVCPRPGGGARLECRGQPLGTGHRLVSPGVEQRRQGYNDRANSEIPEDSDSGRSECQWRWYPNSDSHTGAVTKPLSPWQRLLQWSAAVGRALTKVAAGPVRPGAFSYNSCASQ